MTGGARGLGEAIAARLVRDGGAVALLDVSPTVRRTAAHLAERGPGGPVLAFEVDVSDEAATEGAVAEAVARLEGLDLLVNNAGIGGPLAPLVDAPVSALRRVLEVNLLGAMLVARACAREMVRRGVGGAIVNIGSIYGQQGVAEGAAYCASKGGIALLTHSLALELAPHGIRVNTVAPGNMATEMHREDLRHRATARGTTLEEEEARVRATIPLGRHGTGEDVAAAVAWLASAEA
ncbi:MAG TPA: SDR family oxidoreductase, partial [Actinomycetota bacterium]|nr:SDR family oxidoreductase [Actinomycetota bacterium]